MERRREAGKEGKRWRDKEERREGKEAGRKGTMAGRREEGK